MTDITRSRSDAALAALTLLLAGMTYATYGGSAALHAQGDMSCQDFTTCSGKAHCGESGKESGCTILCASGSIITCYGS